MRTDFIRLTRWWLVGVPALAALVLAPAACSDETETGPSGPVGGPVSGAQDAHCGSKVQPTTEAACHPSGSGGAGGSAAGAGGAGGGGGHEAAAGGAGGEMEEEYPPPMFNAEGDDDDCKYHLKFSASAVRANTDVTFTVTATRKEDNKPATGAATDIEAFLNDTHPAPNSDAKTAEPTPGTYTIGPIRFDAGGRWTVRFHLYEECEDGEESPHSHGAFFIDVP